MTAEGQPLTLISIHALREEGNAGREARTEETHDFYPRPPRGGRRPDGPPHPASRLISIHALREEGDPMCCLSLMT